MIFAWLGARAMFGLSRGIWLAIVAGLIGVAVLWWVAAEKQAAVEADRNAARAEAAARAREADERAHGAAQGKSKEVSDGNERAKAAAAGSDDPLGDGLRSLRAETD
jgi:cytoskeletal protein RodZ